MPIEAEARFAATDPAVLERLAAAANLRAARLGPPSTADELDRYLDTVDGRLSAARWACRLRSRRTMTRISLKGPAEHLEGDWVHRRPEVEGPATDDLDPDAWPESEARSLLRALTGGQPLIETIRLRQRRTERAVSLHGRSVGTLSLDRVTIERPETDARELFIVELELATAASEQDLSTISAALGSMDGLVPEPRSKLEHARDRIAAAR